MATDPQIFISFPGEDRKVAHTLCAALESRGFTCWISSRDILPGDNFQIAIVRAIRKAKVMLLVFTANSNQSEEMNKELALAGQQKMPVIPLRVEDVTPNDAFAYEFATRQWIDFFADWEFAMNQLAMQISKIVQPESGPRPAAAPAVAGPPPVAAAPPTPAPEPKSQAAAPAKKATPPPAATSKASSEAPIGWTPPAKKRLSPAILMAAGVVTVAVLAAVLIALPKSKAGAGTRAPKAPSVATSAGPPIAAAVPLPPGAPIDAAPVALSSAVPASAAGATADAAVADASVTDAAPPVAPRRAKRVRPAAAPTTRATRSDLPY